MFKLPTIALNSHASKVRIKILQARFQQYINCDIPDVKKGFKKDRGTRDHDWLVMVESSDKAWSTGEGNGKPLQYSCLENPMNSMQRQKDKTLNDELPRSVGAQYATGDQWRNNSRKNEDTEPQKKQHSTVDVTGDGSKVWCCKEKYCI